MNTNNRSRFGRIYILLLILFLVFDLFVIPVLSGIKTKETSYSAFLNKVDDKQVENVQIENDVIYYTLEGDDTKYETGQMNDPQLVERLEQADVSFKQTIHKQSVLDNPLAYFLITFILPIVLLSWLMRRFAQRMQDRLGDEKITFTPGDGGFGFGNFGKSNAREYVGKKTGVTFKDVAGQEEAKNNLVEIVDFLNNPKKYQDIGAKMPKGALLVGPPGTGKTLLAKAVAGEAGVPFFSISGSEFVEMFVGRGASRVRDLFKQAREKAPCIIFIDEIDTIGKRRDGAGSFGGNDEREQTLNQLLAEMDGFDGSTGVVLLAATNRPEILDPALTRPGRFDRRIPVELPDLAGREAILRLHAQNIKYSKDIDFNMIARASAGSSGADLANIINEAALLAVRDKRKQVVQRDLEEAIEIVIAGEQKKGAVISTKEKLIVSYHEIGHALVAAKTKNSAPVHKITIIPRTKGALGYTMQVEEDQQNLMSKDELYSRIVTYTAGRAAEEIIFHSVTSGASNDIEMATKLARAMVTRFGMSDTFGMTALETVNSQYLGGDASLACSPATAARVDDEVIALIKQAYNEAQQILKDNISKLHELAKYLYEKETITGEEFMYILNKPAEIPTHQNK